MFVVKRDGRVLPWSDDKVLAAVEHQATNELVPERTLHLVKEALVGMEEIDVEDIQDAVEDALMELGQREHAKHFIKYRENHRKRRDRRRDPDPKAIGDYTHVSKYARYIPDLKRRETWLETVKRLETMHVAKFPSEQDMIREVMCYVEDKVVLPSARSLQFGGIGIESNNARMYNCSFTHANRSRFFQEILFLLLSGCGCGFSVQRHHVKQLPMLHKPDKKRPTFVQVQDTIEGWADSLGELIRSYMNGEDTGYVEFDYSAIRAEGQPLFTSGGKAPGHIPLKLMLEKVRLLLDGAVYRRLKPIEVHDICCLISEAVLAGGVRRSAMISLFSHDDYEMLDAKVGDWFEVYPHRAMANNSAVLERQEVELDDFADIFQRNRTYGEPGFHFTNNIEWGCNPCGEIGLNPVHPRTELVGWAFCNLTEINMTAIDTKEKFVDACRVAAILGTIQATYSDFRYLGETTEEVVRHEALIGVGLTGMMDHPNAFHGDWQREGAKAVRAVNKEWAKKLNINAAARCTTVKPSGTLSLLLGGVGSGIHTHHARRYFRRVTANPNEVPFLHFKEFNPQMCEEKPNGDWVITFPIQTASTAITRNDMSAIEFMDRIFQTYRNWIRPGTRETNGLTHNVSCTVTVKDREWNKVMLHAWENRDKIASMAFLPETGDKVYPFAPREEVVDEADEAKWNVLIRDYAEVDWTKMQEFEDNTEMAPACEGPKCELS